jgi:ABC transport system ATP-binding/permease protein
VAADLGLTDLLKETIGSPENKVLSGGQRKRVNIALELICDTPVLYLDEPTSGLSSADADEVVTLLRRLADEGKTIITTIHAPSLEAYRKFDNLIMLSRDPDRPGAMVFYGPAYPDAIQFVVNQGQAASQPLDQHAGPEVLMKTLQQDKDNPDPNRSPVVWISRYRATKYYKQFVLDRAGKSPTTGMKTSTDNKPGLDFTQWLILAKRNVIVRYRDKSQLLILGLQAPIFALLIAGVFQGLREAPMGPAKVSMDMRIEHSALIGGIHFLMVVAAVWFGCNNAVRDVVGEWLIYQRERMVSLRLPSYTFSKLSVLCVICLFQCLCMLSIVYLACDLRGDFWTFTLILWLASMVGAAIGLLISSAPFCRTTESAIALLPIVLLPMIGLGGGIHPLNKMSTPAQAISNLVATRWAYEANLVDEATQRGEKGCMLPLEQLTETTWKPCDPDKTINLGDLAEDQFPSSNSRSLSHCIIALSAMFVIAIFGVLAALKFRDVH